MRLETESGTEEKIIVRSNRTVTYVGKDIAYQLWKLGLLNRDFNYTTFEYDSQRTPVWPRPPVRIRSKRIIPLLAVAWQFTTSSTFANRTLKP